MTHNYAEVIGDPINHSKSPLIHNFWLSKLSIAAEYRKTCVVCDDLAAFVAARRVDPLWRGCNVTIPHKIAVMDLVDDPGDVRSSIGAMNTILSTPEGLIGTNTDAAGFYAPLADTDLVGTDVVLIGTGGAAHAILFALSRCRVGSVTIMARQPLKAAALLSRFGLKGTVVPISERVPAAQLVINSSPLGMTGYPSPEWDLSRLNESSLVYDIVYTPLETPLILAAEQCGLGTIDGLEMLVGQAATAFELFFGQPAPRAFDDELRAELLA
jgi:shikimate dehydrogenase